MRPRGIIACVLASLSMMACAALVHLDSSDCVGDACDGSAGSCTTCQQDGWTGVNLIDPAAACPAGNNDDVVLVNPKPSGPCTCTCGTAPNPCFDDKPHSLTIRTGTTSCNDGTMDYTASMSCFAFKVSASVNGATATPPTPTKLACPPVTTAPTATSDAKYKVCAVSSGGKCVMHAGAMTCPAQFPKSMTVLTEAEVADSKGCGTCTCTTAATSCAGEVELYGAADCAGSSVGKLPVKGSCSAGEVKASAVSAKFSATGTPAGCTASPAPAMTLPPGRTICCAP